jgi:hypothetical protein
MKLPQSGGCLVVPRSVLTMAPDGAVPARKENKPRIAVVFWAAISFLDYRKFNHLLSEQ